VSEKTQKITDKMEKKSDNFIDTERQLLKLTRSKTKAILEKGNLDKIIRHKEALGKIVKELEELKGHWQRKFLLLHLKEHEKISRLAV
jgi:hypothetical protein